ncbi:MAG: hypothetical protein AAFP16_15425 [Pseudomonadota bacterium]
MFEFSFTHRPLHIRVRNTQRLLRCWGWHRVDVDRARPKLWLLILLAVPCALGVFGLFFRPAGLTTYQEGYGALSHLLLALSLGCAVLAGWLACSYAIATGHPQARWETAQTALLMGVPAFGCAAVFSAFFFFQTIPALSLSLFSTPVEVDVMIRSIERTKPCRTHRGCWEHNIELKRHPTFTVRGMTDTVFVRPVILDVLPRGFRSDMLDQPQPAALRVQARANWFGVKITDVQSYRMLSASG